MKKPIEQINIWYSPKIHKWITCCWMPMKLEGPEFWFSSESKKYYEEGKFYQRERVEHDCLSSALYHIKETYRGVYEGV